MGTVRRVYEFLDLDLEPSVEQTIRDWQDAQPVGHARHPPLHRRAVRPQRRPDPRRLRLLHPALRRRSRRLTTLGRTATWRAIRRHIDESKPGAADLGRADAGARSRSVDNLLAIWRPDGATEAEIQDMNKLALSMLADGLPLPRVHRRPPPGVHAAVELRVQPGWPRPRLRVLERRGRPRGRLPDLRVPRDVALRGDHRARVAHVQPEPGEDGSSGERDATTSTTSPSARTVPSACSSAWSDPTATRATGGRSIRERRAC